MIAIVISIIIIAYISFNQYFPPEVPSITYVFIVILLTLFCSWEGGLAGIANENKKLSEFHDDIEAGKYLILVYARACQEDAITTMMTEKHPDIRLEGSDSSFFNPLSRVQRIQST